MRKELFKKKLLRRAAALVLAAVLVVGSVLPAVAAVPEESNSYGEYLQKAVLYQMLGDKDAGMRYFDQLIQQDPSDLTAYLVRAQLRQAAGDIAGARQDCDYAIGQAGTNFEANPEIFLFGYSVRAGVDFLLGDQAQYLADMQTNMDYTNQIMGQLGLYYAGEDAQTVREELAKITARMNELRSWYNNGHPARNFQTEHANVTGSVGDTAIQINESWSEDDLDTTCNTTFHLSQPVRKMTRKIEETFALVYAMGMEENENGAVAYFVPAGTVLTMEQIFQSGKSRAKNYTTFRAEDLSGEEIWSGESLTVEAGKIYKLDYAASDSVEVYFIAV